MSGDSHVGNGEHDFDGLDELNLPPHVLESIKQARIDARRVIDKLEPFHITSYGDLIIRLEDELKSVKGHEKLYSADALLRRQQATRPKPKTSQGQNKFLAFVRKFW